MKNIYKSFLVLSSFLLIITSCSKDPILEQDPFVIAFDNLSLNIQNISDQENIKLIYSNTANENSTLVIEVTNNIAVYGVDYLTIPAAENNRITIPINKGESQKTFTFKKLNPNLMGNDVFINFKIIEITHATSSIQGNSNLLLNSSASIGGDFEPEVGGPNEGNQVFVDLSNQTSTVIQRDTWDLGFYCGNEFRVSLNGSIFMATKATNYTDIDTVPESVLTNMQTEVLVSNGNPENANYVDAINGDVTETAIDEISETDSENKVYLLNMGSKIGLYTPNTGSVDMQGSFRGWKKIRILKNGDGYTLQYANIEDTTHQEIFIAKDNLYNFIHFSFDTENTVDIEPQKDNWDLCFAPFTYVISNPAYGSYIYSDFIIHNRKGNVASYQQSNTNELNYDNFELTDVNETNFTNDQTTIGSNWRNIFTRSVYNDRFYILKDPDDNYYKIKFTALVNQDGVRGFPQFEYTILE